MDALRTSEIFSDSAFTVIAVESLLSYCGKTETGCHVFGRIEPMAIVVLSRNGAYALDMEAKPVELDQLRGDLPELDALLDQ